MMLANYLRRERRLTGTKIVCAEGDCGACSVLRKFKNSKQQQNRYLAINSCISLVAQMDGSELISIDALADQNKLSPVQEAMVKCHGSQCGFCTPGFVIALTGLVEKKICEKAKGPLGCQETKNALTGNLCRCTGYQPIIDAAEKLVPENCEPLAQRFESKKNRDTLEAAKKLPLLIETTEFSFYAPTSLKDAAKYLSKHKDTRIVGAATDLGVFHNKGKTKLTRLLSLHLIRDLYEIKTLKGRVSVGARVTLSELRRAIKKTAPEFSRFLDLFASPQIKNVATLVGNIGNASPIGDTPPFLLVSDTRVHIASAKAKRTVPLEKFYKGYRQTDLKAGEIITSIDFKLPEKNESVAIYKVSQRKDLDISAVSAAFRIKRETSKKTGRPKIVDLKIAMGGVAATPLLLKKTPAVFTGAEIQNDEATRQLVEKAVAEMRAEMNPMSDLRGSSTFRRVVVENLMNRFCREQLK